MSDVMGDEQQTIVQEHRTQIHTPVPSEPPPPDTDIRAWVQENGVTTARDLYALITYDPLREELSRVLAEIERKTALLDAAETVEIAAESVVDGPNEREVRAHYLVAKATAAVHRVALDSLRARAEEIAGVIRAADEQKIENRRKAESEHAAMIESARQAGVREGLYMLQNEVRRFMTLARQRVADSPRVPEDGTLRLRLRMLWSEMFEMLAACIHPDHAERIAGLEADLMGFIDEMNFEVDLEGLMDASVDVGYVNTGLRIECGVDGVPLEREVSTNNLTKVDRDGGPIFDARGKVMKPEGWQPPQLGALLAAQGWVPSEPTASDEPPVSLSPAMPEPSDRRDSITAPETPNSIAPPPPAPEPLPEGQEPVGAHLRPGRLGRR